MLLPERPEGNQPPQPQPHHLLPQPRPHLWPRPQPRPRPRSLRGRQMCRRQEPPSSVRAATGRLRERRKGLGSPKGRMQGASCPEPSVKNA